VIVANRIDFILLELFSVGFEEVKSTEMYYSSQVKTTENPRFSEILGTKPINGTTN